MKIISKIIFLFVCLISFTAVASSEKECVASEKQLNFKVLLAPDRGKSCITLAETLQDSVQLEIFTAPVSHHAGNPLKFKLTLKKKAKAPLDENLCDKSGSFIELRSLIEKPYKKVIKHNLNPDIKEFFFDEALERTFNIETDVAQNIGGIASQYLYIVALFKDGYCTIRTLLGSQLKIESDNIDLSPPFVRGISYNQESYSPGDSVKATFIFSEPLGSLRTDHIDFTNCLGGSCEDISFPDYGRKYELIKIPDTDTEYEVTFIIPENIPAGSYYLRYFNRYDQVGNFADVTGKLDEMEKRIVEKSPLEVR